MAFRRGFCPDWQAAGCLLAALWAAGCGWRHKFAAGIATTNLLEKKKKKSKDIVVAKTS